MKNLCIASAAALLFAGPAAGQHAGPYKVVKTTRVGGPGGYDYLVADSDTRRLYIPRSNERPRITVFNLDSLAPAGEIPGTNAHGVAIDPTAHHGFSSSKPVVMWDTQTLKTIKTIDVQGSPDAIMFDPFNERVYVLSHTAPHATIIDARTGSVVGTMDLGGEPEQAVSDGAGHLYVDIEDANQVAVVDTKSMHVTRRYDLSSKAKTPAGLAFDVKNHVLFVACRNPAMMVILNSETGQILTTLPIGAGADGAAFNPATMEVFSSQGDGTLTVVKENSPTSFAVEQTVQTMDGARTLTLDPATNRVLLVSGTFGPRPPAAPTTGAGSRGPMLPDSFTIITVGKQ